MPASHHQNLLNLMATARALKDFCNEVVFVGGATTILYVDDPQQSVPRATRDVDCVVEATTSIEYHKAEERMRSLGFKHLVEKGAPICRWNNGPLIVDLMPSEQRVLGFANRWYPEGVRSSERRTLPDGAEVRVFRLPFFVASKLEALLERGMKDLLVSQDLEDILFVMEGRRNFAQDMASAPDELQAFVRDGFRRVSSHDSFEVAVLGNLPRGLVLERQKEILALFRMA